MKRTGRRKKAKKTSRTAAVGRHLWLPYLCVVLLAIKSNERRNEQTKEWMVVSVWLPDDTVRIS